MITKMEAQKSMHPVPNATLRIKLTEDAAHDLLVDRELVMQACPTLTPSIRQPGDARHNAFWDKSTMVKIAGIDEEVRVSTLALNYIDGTYLLSGHELLQSLKEPFHAQFCYSELAAPEWQVLAPDYSYRNRAREASQDQHIILFKILHGQSLGAFAEKDKNIYHHPFLCELIPSVCALADYYGCLSLVISPIIEMLKDYSDFWRVVSENPLFWLRLAVKLQWKLLYPDATRHILAASTAEEGTDDDLLALADHLGMAGDDMKKHVEFLLGRQNETIEDLTKSLRRLQLMESYEVYSRQRLPVRISFANQLEHEKPNRPLQVRSLQTSRFLACSMFGQWFAAQEVGERIVQDTRRKALTPQPFNHLISRLERAATFHNPAGLFGAQAIQQVADMLGHGADTRAVNELRQQANKVVLAANDCIKEAFVTREEDMDGTMVTYGCTNFDMGKEGYFTYLPLDESSMPWEDSEELEAFWQIAIEKGSGSGAKGRLEWEKDQREKEKREQEESDKQRQQLLQGEGLEDSGVAPAGNDGELPPGWVWN